MLYETEESRLQDDLRKVKECSLITRRLEPNKEHRVQIMPLGDVHLGYPTTDTELFKRMVNMCVSKRMYVIGMGDMMECGLTSSIGDSVYRQTLNPDEQIDSICEILRPLSVAGLLLGLHVGNHEERITKATGINVTKIMCNLLNTTYLGSSIMHEFVVDKEKYVVYSTHGSSNARMPYNKIKSALDISHFVNAELILMGHTHGLDHLTTLRYGIKDKKMVELKYHAVLTGSFLKYHGSYAESKNLPPSQIGVAVVSLYGDKHEIFVTL